MQANAFNTLKVTTYADRNEIIESCEMRSFEIDPSVAEEAQAKLLNPKQRLREALRWYCDCPEGEQMKLLQGKAVDLSAFPFSKCNFLLSTISGSNIEAICECICKFDSTWNKYDEFYVKKFLEEQQKSNRFGIPTINDIRQETSEYFKESANSICTVLKSISDSKYRQILFHVLKKCTFQDGITSDIVKKCFYTYELQIKQKADDILSDLDVSINQRSYASLMTSDNTITEKVKQYFLIMSPLQDFNKKCLKSEIVYDPIVSTIRKGVDKLLEDGKCFAVDTLITSLLSISSVASCDKLVSLLVQEREAIAPLKINSFFEKWINLLDGYQKKNNTSQTLLSFLQEKIPAIKQDIPSLPISVNFETSHKSTKIGDALFLSIRAFAIQVANNEYNYGRALIVLNLIDSCYSKASWCHFVIQNDKDILQKNIATKEENERRNEKPTMSESLIGILVGIGIILFFVFVGW